MIVVSTAFRPPADAEAKCRESVAMQTLRCGHAYVDASKQAPPKTITENLRSMLATVPSDEVVVWLDGDDRLAHNGVLAHIARIYRDPDVWLTYGSYECEDGRAGVCGAYRTTDYRREPWKASHLKTFRAGLFNRIESDDLAFELAVDQAVMLPMLEMAGPERIRYVPQVLYIYNYGNSYEHKATPEQLLAEQEAVRAIRSRAPYARLEAI